MSSNIFIVKKLWGHFQATKLDDFFNTANELSQFISNGCLQLSSADDKLLVANWANGDFPQLWAPFINSAINRHRFEYIVLI
jgi:hypothetical protein